MSVLRDVFDELLSMFIGDARLAIGILAVVAIAAVLASVGQPWFAGAALLLGSLALVIGSVLQAARQNAGNR